MVQPLATDKFRAPGEIQTPNLLIRRWEAKAGDRWQELGIIFSTHVGTHIEPRKINEWMADLCADAELSTAGLHKLRHTAATIAQALGVDWKEIQAMLGHASAQITMDIYVDDVP